MASPWIYCDLVVSGSIMAYASKFIELLGSLSAGNQNRLSMTRHFKTSRSAVAKKPMARRRTQAERTGMSDSLMHVAAMKMIGEGGTHNLNLQDVSKNAGYSRSLASARFGTKDALFSELISTASKQWVEGLSESVGDRKGVAALRAWSNGMAALLERNASDLRALYILCYETIGSSESARKLVAETHVTHRSRLERWISEGIAAGEIPSNASPRELSLHYVSLFYGLIYQWLVEPDEIDIVAALRRFSYEIGPPATRRRRAKSSA